VTAQQRHSGETTETQRFAQHEALAHLSSRGVHRVIDHTGHIIQLDMPQAVIDAVDEVLLQGCQSGCQ
jgi:hypothetical protein